MTKDKQVYDGSTMLKSIQQETFTDKMLFFNQTEAYLQAYPTCKSREAAKANASRLLTNANVKARLDYKRAQLAKKMEITEETQIRRFRELSEGAEKHGQFSAAVSAEDRITAICGLYEKDNSQQKPTFNLILGKPERKSIESREVSLLPAE